MKSECAAKCCGFTTSSNLRSPVNDSFNLLTTARKDRSDARTGASQHENFLRAKRCFFKFIRKGFLLLNTYSKNMLKTCLFKSLKDKDENG